MVTKTRSGNTRAPGSLKKLEERSQRGRGAHDLLDNKTFTQALDAIRSGLFDQIAKSTAIDHELREEAYRMIKTIDKLKEVLEIYIRQGDGANTQLKQILEN